MINCEGCEEWYHGRCVGIAESQVPLSSGCERLLNYRIIKSNRALTLTTIFVPRAQLLERGILHTRVLGSVELKLVAMLRLQHLSARSSPWTRRRSSTCIGVAKSKSGDVPKELRRYAFAKSRRSENEKNSHSRLNRRLVLPKTPSHYMSCNRNF